MDATDKEPIIMTKTPEEGWTDKATHFQFPEEADYLQVEDWRPFGCYQVPGLTDASGGLANGFVPTRHELEIVARHYLTEIYRYDYEEHVRGQVSSTDLRFRPFLHRRLATIKDLLGEEGAYRILRPVRDKWETLIEEAMDRCRAKGVDHPQKLDYEDREELLGQAGLGILVSDMRPIDAALKGATLMEGH